MRGITTIVLRFLFMIALVAVGAVIGAEFKPLSDLLVESIASAFDLRLPDGHSRLEFSLTTPRELTFVFYSNERDQGVDLKWSGSEWRPGRPPDSDYSYEIFVFTYDGTRITSFLSEKPALYVGDIGGYLGQTLRFIVQAVGTIRVGEHKYDFKSEKAEFRWTVPAPTPTNTPTATSTPTPTDTSTNTPTNTPTNTSTSTPTNAPTRLPNDSPLLSYVISQPDNLSFTFNARTGGGTVSWSKSNWVPSKPAGSSAISYEVKVVYPNRTFGPYVLSRTRHVFTNLDVQESQRLRFSVKAVGTV